MKIHTTYLCTTYFTVNTERPIFIKNRRSQNRHADGRTKTQENIYLLVQVQENK